MGGDNLIEASLRPVSRLPAAPAKSPASAAPAAESAEPASQMPAPVGAVREQQIWQTGFDQPFHEAIARLSGGLSPLALSQAHSDWVQHLLLSPDKQLELGEKAVEKWRRFMFYCGRVCTDQDCPTCIEPLPQDHRFDDPAWRRWPFNILHQGFLLTQEWWHNATTGVPGVSRHYEDVVSFVARQFLDGNSPSNLPLTNPVVLDETIRHAGANFLKGAQNLWEDRQRLASHEKPVFF